MEQNITISSNLKGVVKVIHAVQNDTGRELKISLDRSDLSSSMTFNAIIEKPSGLSCYIPATYDSTTNIISVELTNQALAEEGNAKAQIEVIDTDGVVTSYFFYIAIEKALRDDSTIESSNEFTALQAMENTIAQAKAQFDNAVSAVSTDTELTDIRVKADGTTATTAGDAVREQITELKEDLTQLDTRLSESIDEIESAVKTGEKYISLNWELGAISGSTGADVDSNTRIRTARISAPTGYRFKFPTDGKIGVVKYTESGVFTQFVGWYSEEFEFIPDSGSTYRFMYDNTTTVSDISELSARIHLYKDMKAQYLFDYVDEKTEPLKSYKFTPFMVSDTRFWNDGVSNVSFADCVWNITFTKNGAYSVIRNLLSNGRKYLINLKVKNNSSNTARLILRQANSSYVWATSLHTFDISANETKYVSVEVTMTADRWVGLYASTLSGEVSVIVDTYIYDITDIPQDVLELYPNENIMGNPFVLSMVSSAEYVSRVGKADEAIKSYGRWYGKKVWFCGDSITEYGWYPPKVARTIGASEYHIDGHSGYSVKGCTDGIVANPSLLDDYDLITLFAGTNDFGGSKPLGTIDDAITEDTTYGALKRFVQTIVSAKKDIRIVMITPLPRGKFENLPDYGQTNSVGKTITDYCEAVQNVGKKYHIPVIDMQNLVGWNEFNVMSKTLDGLHPTEDYTYSDVAPLIASQLNAL